MRLHIAYDEKVINRCVDSFEKVFPGENKYIILIWGDKEQRYVKQRDNLYFVKYDTVEFWSLIGNDSQYSHIIIHYLGKESADFITKVHHRNIYWIAWGGDIYNLLLQQRGFEIYSDKKLLWKSSLTRQPYWLFLLRMKFSLYRTQRILVKAGKKIRYFVPDSMYDEYPLIQKYYPEFKHFEYKEFFYYPIDEVLGSLISSYVTGSNIIIGNSSSVSGNHMDVLNKLVGLNVKGKIIVPLSYGSTSYAKIVNQHGRSLFGDQYVSVTEFMPLDEYNRLLMSANVFIYGNWRQEAVGNILIALYLGGKVFLYDRNPLLTFYKRMGLYIYSLDDIDDTSLSKPLTKSEIETNRRILLENYSSKRQLELIASNFS